MNQQKAKLFRPLFNTRYSYRKLKKAYSGASRETRLKTIATAKRIKETGPVHHMEVPDGRE